MDELRTTDGTIDELLEGLSGLSPREQAAVLGVAQDTEKIGRKTDFTRPGLQEYLADRLRIKQRALEYERAAAGLFADLHDEGVDVDVIPNLEPMELSDGPVVQILLKWLPLIHNRIVTIHIVGVLGTARRSKDALIALSAMLPSLEGRGTSDDEELLGTVVAALQRRAREVGPSPFLRVASDPANGFARVQAISALGSFKSDSATLIPRLLEFLDSNDPQLYREAATILGKWNVTDARPRIEELIDTIDERLPDDEQRETTRDWELDLLRKALWKLVPSS